jgi:hypothetical protein
MPGFLRLSGCRGTGFISWRPSQPWPVFGPLVFQFSLPVRTYYGGALLPRRIAILGASVSDAREAIMNPLFIIVFMTCGAAGPCHITDVAPYLRYGNYEACISDARLYDVPSLRREFGSAPTCIDASIVPHQQVGLLYKR